MPSGSEPFDPYEVLQVSRTASEKQVVASYYRARWAARRASRQTSPAKVQEVEKAFKILKDPALRKRADGALPESGWSRRRNWVLACLLVFLAVVAFSSVMRSRRGICPKCFAQTLVRERGSEGRSTLTCSRGSCDFRREHDPGGDGDDD